MKTTAYWPPTEAEVDVAVERLEAMLRRARENVLAQGRDEQAARVPILAWRDSLSLRGIRPGHVRRILEELERRGLVKLDGPFLLPANERAGARA